VHSFSSPGETPGDCGQDARAPSHNLLEVAALNVTGRAPGTAPSIRTWR